MTESQRPSLTDKKLEQEIRETLNERTPLYEGAMNFSVETDCHTIEAVEQQVTDRLFSDYLKRG
jgi:shikimate kinase